MGEPLTLAVGSTSGGGYSVFYRGGVLADARAAAADAIKDGRAQVAWLIVNPIPCEVLRSETAGAS